MASISLDGVQKVSEDLEKGEALTFAHVGAVFGEDFYFLLIEAFLDAQDAARAIQGAMNRLHGRAEG